jgi:outer membrane receptor protein involved in Fe transport
VNGDQLRQRESRNLFGYNGKLAHRADLGRHGSLSSVFGAGWQFNKIAGSELSHTKDENTVLHYIQYGDTREASLNAYLDENWQVGKWLLNAGARLDYLYFNYRDKLNTPLPARSKWIASPKINLEYTASQALQIYLKTGKGFHSNDAKVVADNQGREILPAAYGADLGLNWKPLPRLYLNASLWYLYLRQEFTYSGDDGTIEAGDPSRRQGIDLSARYQLASWLFATVDLNLSKARDIQAAKGSNYLPLSVPFSSTGGLDFKFPGGFNGAVSYRCMTDRPANEDNSLVAKGYFVTDLTANYTRGRYELGLEVQNLFNTRWREAQFEVESRLRGEARAVDEVSFQSGTPFFARLKMAVSF